MKNVLVVSILLFFTACSTSGYTPIKETKALKKLRAELKEEMESPSYLGFIPQSDPPNFEYKIENRVFAQLYFSEKGLYFEGKIMTNDEFEEALFNLKKKKIKETKKDKNLWIYLEEDGDTNEAYFIDALIIIKKLDMYSKCSEGEYTRERQKKQSQQ